MSAETIIVDQGQMFSVDLRASPGAGYLWAVAAPSASDDAGLQLIEAGQLDAGGGKMPGDPAQQRFSWRANTPGHYQLTLALKRPWESAAIDTHVLNLEVRAAAPAPT